jgi:hypothetical protein
VGAAGRRRGSAGETEGSAVVRANLDGVLAPQLAGYGLTPSEVAPITDDVGTRLRSIIAR